MKTLILQNISWLFVDKIIRISGALIVSIWIARYLGPEDFGVLNYSLAYVVLFSVFIDLGLSKIVVREAVRSESKTNVLLGTAFGMKLAGAIIAILVIYLSLEFSQGDGVSKQIILILSAGFIFQSMDVIDYFYQSKVQSKYVVLCRSLAFILSAIFKIFLIVYEFSVIYFAIATFIDLFFASFFLVAIYNYTGYSLASWKFRKKTAIDLLSYSWPLAISGFLIAVHMKIDQVMIGNMLNNEQVGIYSVAVRLSEFWYIIPGILISTLMPYFVTLRERSNSLYHLRLMQMYSFMFWSSAVVGFFVIFFGERLIGAVFGEAYTKAYEALVFNIWNGIFVSQALARGIWLLNEDLHKYRLYNNILAVILNICANLFLIPRFGITGAAISTLVTQALGTWVFSFFWQPLRASTWAMIKSINPYYLVKSA